MSACKGNAASLDSQLGKISFYCIRMRVENLAYCCVKLKLLMCYKIKQGKLTHLLAVGGSREASSRRGFLSVKRRRRKLVL